MTLSLGEAIKSIKKQTVIKPIPLANAKQIAVVIPVKDNQEGINKFLDSFFLYTDIRSYPTAIIIVDNNSKKLTSCPLKYYKNPYIFINIITCETPGPAAARNLGAKIAIDKYKADWIFFTDSDCLCVPETFINLKIEMPDSVGYQCNIIPSNDNWLSRFYHEHSILKPLPVWSEGTERPEAIITAGVLILANAFSYAKGFDEDFPEAAGEDICLGITLRTVGELSYLNEVIIKHDFTEFDSYVIQKDLFFLVKRFYRYGKGNNILEKKLLSRFDIEINKSVSEHEILARDDFLFFIRMFCNPTNMTFLPGFDDKLILKLGKTAMFYGYHNCFYDFSVQYSDEILSPIIQRNLCINQFRKLTDKYLIENRHKSEEMQREFDKRFGLMLV